MQSIISQYKPHFYQYMQIQLLQSYIQKGITYFVNSILNSSPKLIGLRYYSEEISFLINFVKDFICLNKYGGTYAEQFFSLQRSQLSSMKIGRKMKILYHTLVMTLVPYLSNKIETFYNSLVEEQANQGRILNFLQKLFTTLYPYAFMIMNAIQVLMKFRYLLKKDVKVFDLYYKVSGTKLNYKQEKIRQRMNSGDKVHYPWSDLLKTPGLLAIVVGHKVLGWYFTQKNQRNTAQIRNTNGIDKYISPLKSNLKRFENQHKKEQSHLSKGLCLICSKSITNPTVIKQSGHVFCYTCISEYVKQNAKCPISGIRVNLDNLQLVYSSSS